MSFLSDFELRQLSLPQGSEFSPVGLALGQGPHALEVMLVQAEQRPTAASMRRVWNTRLSGRAVPLLLVALYDDKAALCGPAGPAPQVYADLDPTQAERLCRAALSEPDRHAALRFLSAMLPEVEGPLPGVRNEGLIATHELAKGVPLRADWAEASNRAARTLDKRGEPLLRALGFDILPLEGPLSVLAAQGTKVSLAVLLDRSEAVEVASERFSGLSPIAYALARADRERLPYVVVSVAQQLRLYPVEATLGTGRRGRTETFIQVHLDLLPTDQAAYLWLLLSADALSPGGTLGEILERSADYSADLGTRLRERIYTDVVPHLASAIASASQLDKPTAEELSKTYQMALCLLFRLLFVAYAEDEELLPYRTNDLYRRRSLKQKAHELLEVLSRGVAFGSDPSQWDEVRRLFAAIDGGKREWGVPAYDGGLFLSDPEEAPIGAALDRISLGDDAFAPPLAALLLEESAEGLGPVDFRSLGVREFGTIYEGLLESELSVAQTDLGVGPDGLYVPEPDPETAEIRAGEVYLHNASGARKSTGSYYTKSFAVDHLLEHALEPALEEHLRRLDALDDSKAGQAFFDFRVVDIAMGSGHFLVSTVDRIERRLAAYVAERRLPSVIEELARLRDRALQQMETLGTGLEIEDTQLLRRQIARRCIYGVDLNPTAVELARLSLWIHTFVPGLPLSLLDYNLVVGNSLVGIASMKEASELLGAEQGDIFSLSAQALLGEGSDALRRLGRLSDADAAEVAYAREAYHEASDALRPAAALFDVLAASRLDPKLRERIESGEATRWAGDPSILPDSDIHKHAQETLAAIPPFHFPIAFPQVFLRDRSGFDVIVGNPPWEEATLEEDRFWARYAPGLQAMRQREQEAAKKRFRAERSDLVARYEEEVDEAELLRHVLTTGPFPGMGTGDPDLYKAFVWRFWALASRDGGNIGVVLPRSAFAAKGAGDFRKTVFRSGCVLDLTTLLNNRQWVFEDVHPQYTIALCSLRKAEPDDETILPIRGPFRSLASLRDGVQREPIRFLASDVMSWTDTAALPLLPTEESVEVFAQLRKAPRLDLDDGVSWRVRPYAELHATNDKRLMDLSEECPQGFWPVYKGQSFDIWDPDTGSYYAWADPDVVLAHLQAKRERASRNRRSPFSEFEAPSIADQATLSCLHPRIAFRDVTNRTNRRTVIVALLPPEVLITNAAPYLLWPRGDEKDQAFLLGILSSLPLDWYARRFVELHVNYHVFNPFPVPRPSRDDPLWRRTVEIAGRLACPDGHFETWGSAVGVQLGPMDPDAKSDMIAELDAVVAHLYGLTESHLRHIFETFHEGWDYQDRLEATLVRYRNWRDRT